MVLMNENSSTLPSQELGERCLHAIQTVTYPQLPLPLPYTTAPPPSQLSSSIPNSCELDHVDLQKPWTLSDMTQVCGAKKLKRPVPENFLLLWPCPLPHPHCHHLLQLPQKPRATAMLLHQKVDSKIKQVGVILQSHGPGPFKSVKVKRTKNNRGSGLEKGHYWEKWQLK